MSTALIAAARAVLKRWDSPTWEWLHHGPTADLMNDLRKALGPEPAVARPDGDYSVTYKCRDCGHEQLVTEIVTSGGTYAGSGANWCDKCGDGLPVRVAPAATELRECAANGASGCRIGPHGPNGEQQCEWCGEAPQAAHICSIKTDEPQPTTSFTTTHPAGEPVAWGQLGLLNGRSYLRQAYDRTPYPPPAGVARELNLVPLYAAPQPAAQPLTDEQIATIHGQVDTGQHLALLVFAFARAIEAAHGIKEET